MLSVLEVATHVFWSDDAFDRKLLPPPAALESCTYTIGDLSTMSGKERLTVFKDCGIHSSLFPLFLRALQHLTSVYPPGRVEGGYLIHRYLSAHQWHPGGANGSLLGYPNVVSEPFRERCETEANSAGSPVRTAGAVSSGGFSRYNGLLNQGATCYLNSLLQALFHISAFRSVIYQMPTKEEAEERRGNDATSKMSIPYALQRLFCHMQTSTHAVGTKELTESFGWSSSDSFIQHDVHELTRVLLDNLEEKLNAQSSSRNTKENAIHRFFNGTLESYVKVEEANYYGAREEPFYDLQLVVKNKNNIYESFDAFFQVEVLDGKNRYCLEADGKKTYHRAEKGVRFKEVPPILLLHLARFDYDIDCGETKIFSRWDYYNTLDLSKYMPQAPPSETHYTLCSVLVHSGSATGFGHYFCFLMCSGAWYKFNDEMVTPATLKEVFGANFGGCKLNYWGSEVPNISNAYMLVYIRTSQMDSLLSPISQDDVPPHVVEQLIVEQKEEEQRLKELAEDHLYGRLHFILPTDIAAQEEFLISRRPVAQKFSSHNTLRILLEDEALPALLEFAQRQCNVSAPECILWYASTRTKSSQVRLFAQVKEGMKVKNILGVESECCILCTSPANTPWIEWASDQSGSAMDGNVCYELFHHKLYDPLELRLLFLGCTVVRRNPSDDPATAVQAMEDHVRQMIADLVDEEKQYLGHHLRTGDEPRTSFPSRKQSQMSLEGGHSHHDLFSKEENVLTLGAAAAKAVPKRGYPEGALSVVRETEDRRFLPCKELSSGDILIWTLDMSHEDPANIFYPDVSSFQHFLIHRIPVKIQLNRPPDYPLLIDTELAEDMTYGQLQRYVARLIGDAENYDRIRFARHNPETEKPYFMKGKKQDQPELTHLLKPASSRFPTLSTQLYYEYCKFTVSEIEASHSLQFKLYGENVKPISPHWVLLSREVPLSPEVIFQSCITEVQRDYTAGRCPQFASLMETSIETTPTAEMLQRLLRIDPPRACDEFRLADVWRGRIYNIMDKNRGLALHRDTFEESAEYRIEALPRPVADIPVEDQVLLPVFHFSMVRQRREPVETHSEPFSMYVNVFEQPASFLRRVAQKLEMSYAAVQDWKVCLVRGSNVVFLKAEELMGKQINEFCPASCFEPNMADPIKSAFIGLEHAPLSKRGATKRDDRMLILN